MASTKSSVRLQERWVTITKRVGVFATHVIPSTVSRDLVRIHHSLFICSDGAALGGLPFGNIQILCAPQPCKAYSKMQICSRKRSRMRERQTGLAQVPQKRSKHH